VATRVSASLNPVCGTWAALAYDGKARGQLVLDRVAAWLIRSWIILGWLVGTALTVAVSRLAVRRHRRLMLERNGGEPRRASSWTRRRRQKAAAIGLCVVVVTAAALTPEVLRPAASQGLTAGAAVWWSEADAKQAVTGGVSGLPVAEIPIRSGHQQGYLLHLVNGSGVDQRVLGVPESDSSGFAASAVTLTVSTVDAPSDRARSLTYTTRGLVPAHQARWLRVLWVSEGCFEAGSSSSTDALALRVRLGWITRTEDVPIFPGIGVRGPSQPAPSGDRTTCAG
jgi:hypothetical protein